VLPAEIQSKFQFTFVGPIKDKRYHQEILSLSHKFSGKIQFKGDISETDLSTFYRSSHIFCLTPITLKDSVEGFGFVYLEASAYGLPIIATRVGGVEDAVLDGKTGLLSDPKNLDDLAQNLLKLTESKKLRKEMGIQGQKWSAQHNWPTVAKEIYSDS
jgi:glycosyltransferase involved in cell wall biosynthesis